MSSYNGTSLWRKRKGDHLSRLTKATLGSGLAKEPSPACAGAQDTGVDNPTLWILAWVQTGSGAPPSVQTKATSGSDTGTFCTTEPG